MELINTMQKNFLWGNSFFEYFIAIIIFFALVLALKVFQAIILSRLYHLAEKTETDFDDTLIDIFKKIKPPFYFFLAIYFSIQYLAVAPLLEKVLLALFLVAIVFEVVQALSKLLDYFVRKYFEKNKEEDEDDKHSEAMVKLLGIIVKIILWAIGFVMILSNLGINVTSLVAGLGVGGIAIALALQTILGDLFSAFAIYLDKPFKVGDFIVIGTDMGVVEKIGIKTTRIKTLQGEQLVVSNQELTKARIQNFQKMENRRVVLRLGVLYETAEDKLKQIPEIIKKVVDDTEGAEFDRAHFADYGDFSLNFETVFYVNSPEYNVYMDIRQKVNYQIFNEFAKVGIEFAYPTQKIFLSKE